MPVRCIGGPSLADTLLAVRFADVLTAVARIRDEVVTRLDRLGRSTEYFAVSRLMIYRTIARAEEVSNE